MTALPIPSWLWPAQSLDYGITGPLQYTAAHFGPQIFSEGTPAKDLLTDGWIRMNQPATDPPFSPLVPMAQSFPRTSQYMPISQSFTKRRAAPSLKFFQSHYPDLYVPPDLLLDNLSEGHRIQRETELYDPFLGDLFDLGQIPTAGPGYRNLRNFAAFPMGEVGNELNISLLAPIKVEANCSTALPITYEFHRLQPHAQPVVSFRTPIRQICISKPILHRRGQFFLPLLAVRTYSGVTFFRLLPKGSEYDPRGPSPPATAELLDEITPSREGLSDYHAMHVAMSPYWIGEACVVGSNGCVVLWSAEKRSNSPPSYRVRTLRDPRIHANPSNQDTWMSCDYGAHPRSVLIASTGGLELLDFRMPPASAPVTLYVPPAKSRIHAFRRPPLGIAFQTFLTTSSEIVVVDQRFPSRPVLAWAHHRELDPPSGIEVVDEGERDDKRTTTLLTWTRRDPRIVAHRFISSASGAHPPISIADPCALPAFSSHAHSSPFENDISPRHTPADDEIVIPPLVGLRVFAGRACPMKEDEKEKDGEEEDEDEEDEEEEDEEEENEEEENEEEEDKEDKEGEEKENEEEEEDKEDKDGEEKENEEKEDVGNCGDAHCFTIFQLAKSGEVYEQPFRANVDGHDGGVVAAAAAEATMPKWSKHVCQLAKRVKDLEDEARAWDEIGRRKRRHVNMEGVLEYLTDELLPDERMRRGAAPLSPMGTSVQEKLDTVSYPLTLYEILKDPGGETKSDALKGKKPHYPSPSSSRSSTMAGSDANFEAHLANTVMQLGPRVASWPVVPQTGIFGVEGNAGSLEELVRAMKAVYIFPNVDDGSGNGGNDELSPSTRFPLALARSARHQAIANLARDIRGAMQAFQRKQPRLEPPSQPGQGESSSAPVAATYTSARPPFAFKYIFANASRAHRDINLTDDSNNDMILPPAQPTPIVSNSALALLAEWRVGEDPSLYEYVNPDHQPIDLEQIGGRNRKAKRATRNSSPPSSDQEERVPGIVVRSSMPTAVTRGFLSQPGSQVATTEQPEQTQVRAVAASQPEPEAFGVKGERKKKKRIIGF